MSLIWRYKSLHLSSFKGHYLQFKPLLINMATCTSSSIDPLSKSNIGLVNSLTDTSDSDGYFAFARINDQVYLVQGIYKFVFLFFISYIQPFLSFMRDPSISIDNCWRQNIPPWIHHRLSILWIKDLPSCRHLHRRTHRWPLDTLWRGERNRVSRKRLSS